MKSEFTPVSLESEFRQIVSRQRECSKPDQKDYLNQRQAGWMRRWSGWLLDFFTGSQRLSVRQRSLPNGTLQWIVYDPDAERSRVFDSEQAVRAWLEQRYYQ